MFDSDVTSPQVKTYLDGLIEKQNEILALIPVLAQSLATDILTVADRENGGIECTRAQMMLMQPDGKERNMGGRCKDSLVCVIEYHLREKLCES
jgi:hypothetical protein